MFSGEYDYIYGETMAPVEKRTLDAVSMDSIFRDKKVPAPPPDFLSIDVEAAEYELLVGAKETLKDSVLALNIEIEFHKIHKDQKLFGDVCALLSEQGFYFAQFNELLPMSMYRTPVGLRGSGILINGEALFLRKIDDLDKINDAAARKTKLRKLAFISILYGQIEYGLECLRRSAGSDDLAARPTAYGRFLDEFAAAAARVPKSYPGTFASYYTAKQSLARFDAIAKPSMEGKSAIKRFLKSVPLIGPLMPSAKRLVMRVQDAYRRGVAPLTPYSEVERLLLSWGLAKQANALWLKRLAQTPYIRS